MNTNHIYCQQCGQPNHSQSKHCHNCGAQLVGQPPVGMPASPVAQAPTKKSGCWRNCLIITLILVCLGGVAVTAVGLLYGEEIITTVEGWLTPVPGNVSVPGGTTTSGSNSLAVASSEGGVVTAANGASITVPAGAVPVMDDGNAGTMVFSIQEDNALTPTLSGELEPVGPVYHLGPEGFVFAAPVLLTLPIPEDVDPNLVIGLTFFDEQANIWKLVPGKVDEQARTVAAETTHFSSWGIFGSCITNIGGCNNSREQWKRERGGWFKISNTHVYETGIFPGGRNLPMSTSYGVCIKSYNFTNPNDAWNWLEPMNWTITARDSKTVDYWLPAGQYELIDVYYMSEVNHSPLYVPAYTSYWRSLGVYTLDPGETIAFSSSSVDLNAFTEGRPPCWGEMTTSVGTGDVQVTLTWQAYADIDLYVEDPSGDVVYYSNDYIASGGQLDRDNTCGDFIQGQPENIFWPEEGAPSGEYKVKVHYYGDCESTGPVAWTVRTVVGGQVQTFNGTLGSEGDEQPVTNFTIP